MDGLAITDLKSVTAPLNFLAPMAEKPVAYNYEPPPGNARQDQPECHLSRAYPRRAADDQPVVVG